MFLGFNRRSSEIALFIIRRRNTSSSYDDGQNKLYLIFYNKAFINFLVTFRGFMFIAFESEQTQLTACVLPVQNIGGKDVKIIIFLI